MSVTISLTFDDEWAARLAPMVETSVQDAQQNKIIVSLIESLPGVDSVDDLSIINQGKLLILFDWLCRLQRFEGDTAAAVARSTVITDIAETFPLEVGND